VKIVAFPLLFVFSHRSCSWNIYKCIATFCFENLLVARGTLSNPWTTSW